MPLFSMETLFAPISMLDAWEYVVSVGNRRPKDNCLVPEECDESDKIIWLERIRQFALEHGGNLSVLEPYVDFRSYAWERRPDPTWDQWIWLYQQIGAYRGTHSMRVVIPIMACRDALLPFLASVPNKDIEDDYKEFFSMEQPEWSDTPFPYPNLEEAFQRDASAEVELLQIMCHGVSKEAILNRAIKMKKGSVVATMLKNAPIDKVIKILIGIHANWQDPASSFDHILPQREDEIAAWRDPWGNGFFWYLYRRPVLSLDIIRGLPPKVLATFETKNRYGISPKDLWNDYRPS